MDATLAECSTGWDGRADPMLFKKDSATALSAQFPEAPRSTAMDSTPASTPLAREAPEAPSQERLEIERLQLEARALREELQLQRSTLQETLERGCEEARALAARQHIADDQARLNAHRDALASALDAFKAALLDDVRPMAKMLAGQALSRLVTPQLEDFDWLARSIERRLDGLRAGAVINLAVAPGLEDAQLHKLRELLPSGASVVIDQTLKPGTAKFTLQLGEVTIDPASGLAFILTALENG